MSTPLDVFENRIAALETRNRWLIRYVFVSLIAVAVIGIAGAANQTERAIRASKFELTDESGRVIAVWGRVPLEANSNLRQLGSVAKSKANEITLLQFFDRDDKPCAGVGTDGFGGFAAALNIYNGNSAGIAELWTGDGQGLNLGSFDKKTGLTGWSMDRLALTRQQDGRIDYTIPPGN